MIQIDRLCYRYREQAPKVLAGFSLHVPPGEFLLVAGPSGSGKSTLLRALNGLVPRFHGGVLEGRVRVAGRDPSALGPGAMSDVVGFVFQDPESQFVTERVDDELAFSMENEGLPRAAIRRAIGHALDLLGLRELEKRPLSTLSGGERQRVAVASALTLAPKVLVLDEPTSQIDPAGAEDLLGHLRRLNREIGLTVVLSEHRIDRVAPFADRVCLLPGLGAPAHVGPAREILAETVFAPPVARLAGACGEKPPPLTVEEARDWAGRLDLGSELGAGSGPEPESGQGTQPSLSPGLGSKSGDPALLSSEGLEFSFPGKRILTGVEIQLQAGERVALMGSNGCGKSTLLKNLVGLLRPDRGIVRLRGQDQAGRPLTEMTSDIGFVPQNPSRLLFSETVLGEVAFTREAHGLDPGDPLELLSRLGMAELATAYPRDLSTGERQRVALASILAAEPAVLLLDEPTRGLDPANKEALRNLLLDLSRAGTAVLLATHDVELAARLADRILILEGGLVARDGPPETVLAGVGPFATQIGRLLAPRPLITEDAVLRRIESVDRP